jgi:hypothetical protein
MEFTGADQAREYIRQHDNRVRFIDRKPNASLRSIYLSAMSDANLINVLGGPVSHDELVNAIIDLEFPDITAARSVYVNSIV